MTPHKRIKLSVRSFYLDDNINDIYCEFGKTYLKNSNIDEALKWFKNALDNNDTNVYNYLGNYYKNIEDIKNSERYFIFGIEKEDLKCFHNLAILYLENNINIKKAILYLKIAANGKVNKSINILARIYYFGYKQIKKDINEAIYYLNLSSQNGDNESKFNLAYLYFNGIGVLKNIDVAIGLLKEASESCERCMYFLGIIYYYNIKNEPLGLKYINKAAKWNYPKATIFLKKINSL